MSHDKPQQSIAHVYNPENQTADELIRNFVIRTKPFEKIFKSITSTSIQESPQHFLIEGQRGTGKTSLMLRVRYELERTDRANYIIPVQLPEEQYGVFDLCRLWELIADYLCSEQGFSGLIERLDSIADQSDYPLICFTVIDEYLDRNMKRLVLFIDNFGDMLDRFSDIEQKRLRDIFHTSKHVQLVAASAKTLEHTYKYEQPFYEFFKIIRLKNLSNPETISLLRQLAIRYDAEEEINRIAHQEPERIETIRLLTGGVPRTIILLFEIFLDESGNVFEDLDALLDRVTPLYKHRMDDLKPQQQAIMDVLALNWDGIGTAEIVKRLKGRGFDNKKISAQLAALEKNDLINSVFVDKKNKIYFIRERFFNIWYLMRLGRRRNGDRVMWLVKFLQQWYEPKALIQRTREHIGRTKKGELSLKGAYHLSEALAKIVPDMELQDELLNETKNFISQQNMNLAEELSISDKELLKKAKQAFKYKNYSLSINYLESIVNQNLGQKNYYIGKNLDALGKHDAALCQYKKAIVVYQLAIDKGETAAINNLGNVYADGLKDYDKAIETYQLAIDKGDTRAIINLGNVYADGLKDYDKAIETYQLAIDKGDTGAINNLGILYADGLKDYDKAIETYQLAIDKGDVCAMNSLSWFLFDQNRLDQINEATALAQKAVSIQRDFEYLDTLANVLLWRKEFSKSDQIAREILQQNAYQDILVVVANYFIFLMASKQNHSALKLFLDFPKLQDEIKPVYYALMTLLKDEYPKEHIKMGEELETIVADILKKVEIVREKYKHR